MSRILKCSCRSEYQDSRYGTGNRVMNRKKGGTSDIKEYRCTVCGAIRDVRPPPEKKPDKEKKS